MENVVYHTQLGVSPLGGSSSLIYQRMANVMKEIGAIGKDQKNNSQGYNFRGIEGVMNALHPALVKHEIFLSPKVSEYKTELREVTRSNGKAGIDKHVSLLVEYTFWTTDGSSVTVGPIAAEGLDSGDKATNKALAAGLKYALTQGFMIPTADTVDADSESPEIGTKAQVFQQETQQKVTQTASFRKPKASKPVEEITDSSNEWQ